MAPEVYLRKKQSEKVDVWALGILFYEMSHFQTPFKNDSLEEIEQKLKNRQISFKKEFPEEFRSFIYEVL